MADIFERLKTAKLPGGVILEINDKIQEVQDLSSKVKESVNEKKQEHKDKPSIPLTEANSRLIELGLNPSPSGMNMDYYREISNQNPNLSLAGLRMEIDILSKNLAKGFQLEFDEKRDVGRRLFSKLLETHSITNDQYELVIQVLNLCNKAVHGIAVSHEQALSIIDSADVLIDDYLSWMGWGFDDNWKNPTEKGNAISADVKSRAAE